MQGRISKGRKEQVEGLESQGTGTLTGGGCNWVERRGREREEGRSRKEGSEAKEMKSTSVEWY